MLKIICIFVFVANISLAANITGGLLTVPPATNNNKSVNNLKTVKMEKEIWKSIKGYEGIYIINNTGKVKSLQSNKILKSTKYNYERIGLSKDGKQIIYSVHRLVAIAFIKNIYNKRCVHHKDNNKLNNNCKNLEWVTIQENTQRAYDDGLLVPKKLPIRYGKDNHRSIPIIQLTKENVIIAKYDNARIAYKETGIHFGLISRVLTGEHKTAGGYKWKKITQK